MGDDPDEICAPASRSADPRRRYSTGSPKPPPVWQLLCEFANGACVCAHTARDRPCHAVEVMEQRIRNVILAEFGQTRRATGRPRS